MPSPDYINGSPYFLWPSDIEAVVQLHGDEGSPRIPDDFEQLLTYHDDSNEAVSFTFPLVIMVQEYT